MFMLKVYKNITGYVEFNGAGVFPERFLNLCAKENIPVWNPKVDIDKISGCMYINDYKRIRKLAKKSCMVLKIKKKVGLPFLIKRYRHRYGIPVGAMLFFLIIWYLSGFCFNITINGNTNIEKDKILTLLAQSGVYNGRRISEIDTELTRQKFLINNPEFSFAAINIKGCFVSVELTQTQEKENKNDDSEPQNIIAKKAGKILKIKAYEGVPAVKIGEAVAKGDLLVSGVIELTNKSTKFVCSNAQVIAQTRYKLSVFVPFENYERLTLPKQKKRTVLSISNVNIPLFFGEIEKPYKVKTKTKKYSLFGVELPIKTTTAHFNEIEKRKITLNEDSAKQLARDKINLKAKKRFKNNIKQQEKGVFQVEEEGVRYTQVFICEENIATAKKILKNFSQN